MSHEVIKSWTNFPIWILCILLLKSIPMTFTTQIRSTTVFTGVCLSTGGEGCTPGLSGQGGFTRVRPVAAGGGGVYLSQACSWGRGTQFRSVTCSSGWTEHGVPLPSPNNTGGSPPSGVGQAGGLPCLMTDHGQKDLASFVLRYQNLRKSATFDWWGSLHAKTMAGSDSYEIDLDRSFYFIKACFRY